MTLVGWLLTILPSSLPFHVPSSSLNCDDLSEDWINKRKSIYFFKKYQQVIILIITEMCFCSNDSLQFEMENERKTNKVLTCCRVGRRVRNISPCPLDYFPLLSCRHWFGPCPLQCDPVALYLFIKTSWITIRSITCVYTNDRDRPFIKKKNMKQDRKQKGNKNGRWLWTKKTIKYCRKAAVLYNYKSDRVLGNKMENFWAVKTDIGNKRARQMIR